jgi:LysM repeat protein/serine/threonine protein phosphatase PrpC
MASEQKISASVFSHRGDAYDSNTNNFILDGRQLYGFEQENSHVSISGRDKYFFFAVCDTKPTVNLNTSVSGIKELKKLHAQFKTGARDVKAKTETLGECFINTENLLYDSGSYSSPQRRGLAEPKLSALDKKLSDVSEGPFGVSGADDAEDADDDQDGEYGDERAGGAPRYPEGAREEPYADELDLDEADDEDEVDYADELDEVGDRSLAPGEKGFSTVGFVLSEKKGSILAQGDCEAFLLRNGALRVLSGGNKKVSVSLNRPHHGAPQEQAQRQGAPRPYAGRASEIFEPREGDVFLLCTSPVINAIGEENIDSYLAMDEELSVICGAVMNEAVKNDPSSNMTCMLVRMEESREDEAFVSPLSRRPEFSYGPAGGAQAQGRPIAAASAPPPEYAEQDGRDTRIAPKPQFQNGSAFAKRPPSRFEAPPQRKFGFASNRSLMTSVLLAVGLVILLFVTYWLWMSSTDNNASEGNRPTVTPRNSIGTTAADGSEPYTDAGGDDDFDGGYDDGGEDQDDSVMPTTLPMPTTTSTTEPPPVIHKVVSGETLSKIAEKYYSSAKLYTLIKEANGLTKDDIRIGQELVIPPKPDAMTTAAASASPQQGAGSVTVTVPVTVPRQSAQ